MSHTPFTGTIRVHIHEAEGLRPTDTQRRHNMAFSKPDTEPTIDPYVCIDIDEMQLGKFNSILCGFFYPTFQ